MADSGSALDVPVSGDYTIIAHDGPTGDNSIALFSNDTAGVAEGRARLTLRHVADASILDLVVRK